MKAIKQLGQNFLINPGVSKKIVDASNPQENDTFVEIGPGKAALTKHLAVTAKSLICIEKDRFLAQKLVAMNFPNTKIITGDILDFDPKNIDLRDGYKVIGSLPFNISKKIIWKFLTSENPRPATMTFVVQKEVAENYAPEDSHSTVLSLTTKLFGECAYLFTIKKSNFRPIPKVDSAVIQFRLKKPEENAREIAKFTKKIFNKPRKTLKNNLKYALKEESIKITQKELLKKLSTIIDLQKRPSKTSITDIIRLYEIAKSEMRQD